MSIAASVPERPGGGPRSIAASVPERPIDRLLRSQALYVWGGLLLLFALQVVSGTDPLFALLVMLFGLLSAATISQLGGLNTLMGLCVLMLDLQHVFIAQIAKIVFWLPADKPLINPLLTMSVYNVAMASMWLAAFVWQKTGLRECKPILPSIRDPQRLFWLTIICTVLALGRTLLTMKGGDSGGAQGGGGSDGLGPLRVITFLGPLSVACGTAYMIVSTDRRKSVGALNIFPILLLFLLGFVGAGRGSMALGVVTYYMTCYSFRFRFRASHIIALAAMAYVAIFILFPYAVVARSTGVRKLTGQAALTAGVSLLIKIVTDPLRYQTQAEKGDAKLSIAAKKMFYYGHLSGLDRYAILMPTDAIVDATIKQGTIGMTTIEPGFHMLLPRILDPDKPNASVSNMIAHRVKGLVGKKDKGTGITLGFVVDSFSSFGWAGVMVIPFLILLSMTTTYRALFDDRLAFNVIPLAMIFNFPGLFSEGPITPQILSAFQGPIIIVSVIGFMYWLVHLIMGITARNRGQATTTAQSGRLRERGTRERAY